MSLDPPSFRPRFPWWGGDLQTLANRLRPIEIDLAPHRTERLSFALPDGTGDGHLFRRHPLQQPPPVGMEKGEQLGLAAALEGHQAELAAQVGGDVAVAAVAGLEGGHLLLEVGVVGVGVTHRLVGESRDLALEPGFDPGGDGGGLEGPPLLDPLRLDGGVGPEAEGPVSQPAGDLEAEQGLAGTGWHHDVGAPAAFRPRPLEGIEGEQLVAAEGLWIGHRREELAQLAGRHRPGGRGRRRGR